MAKAVCRRTLSRLFLLLVSVCMSVSLEEGDVFQWPLYMPAPGNKPLKHNDYRCRASELPQNDNYIVSYEPRADPNVAHHMLVYGCNSLRQGLEDSSSWKCKSSTICGSFESPHVIYAWALNASGFQLPPGVGQKVGFGNGMNYLVVQIHYGLEEATEMPSPAVPKVALILHMTELSQERVSGVYLLGSGRRIAAGKESTTTDTACRFKGPKSIVPIAFRTHAHAHSTLIVGYVGDGGDQWTEIGFRSPQDPQAFYPVVNDNLSVKTGDWLASRCVYNTSGRSHDILMGPDSEDEMCNFYIMYHTANDGRHLTSNDCWEPAKSTIHYPPLPVLPPSHHHHDHSIMGGGSDDEDDVVENVDPTPIVAHPITSSSNVPTSPVSEDGSERGGMEELLDDYLCPSSIPPVNGPSRCPQTTPTNLEEGEGLTGKEESNADDIALNLVLAEDWPFNGVDYPHVDAETGRGGGLGQVTSVAVTADGSVLLLHRGPRVWGYSTFSYTNIFVDAESGPIATPTVIKFSREGAVQRTWGAGLFYLPHSITVDHRGYIWVTDVAMHQVFMFTSLDSNQPSLTLGHKLTPGSKFGYFCKPTDVAVSSSGTFYVADGYCNHRVIAYNSNGMMKNILANLPIEGETLSVPHSLALNPAQDQLFVADRENGRIVSISVSTGGVQVFSADTGLARVFALCFSGLREGGWPLVTVSEAYGGDSGRGTTVGSGGEVEVVWGVKQRFIEIHDLTVDSSSKAVYVTELNPPRIWKFVYGDANPPPSESSVASEAIGQPVSPTQQQPTVTEQPPATPEQQPHGTAEQPPSTTERPLSTTEQLQDATEQPPSTTERPLSTTEQLQGATEQPPSTTERPQDATEQLPSTTERPLSTTEPTQDATEQPSSTTERPLSTTEPTQDATEQTPGTTKQEPSVTTAPPTDKPDTSSSSPTTSSPASSSPTTSANNGTTTAPEVHVTTDTDNSTRVGGSNKPADPDLSSSSTSTKAETTGVQVKTNADSSSPQSSKSKSKGQVSTPAYHYGLFAAIFAIVALILVVVVGILKEHRYCRFRGRRSLSQTVTFTEPKSQTPRDTLHSLLGPSKLGFSRLRTYDSDSEVEEFPIFSRQS